MLKKTNLQQMAKDLAPEDKPLQNLAWLIEVGIPFTREKQKDGRVNFDYFVSSCGTYRCLLGWSITIPGSPISNKHDAFDVFDLYQNSQWGRIFGVSFSGGTLDDREAYARKLFDERIERYL